MMTSCAFWVLQLLGPTLIQPWWYLVRIESYICYIQPWSNHDHILCILNIEYFGYYTCYVQPWSNHDNVVWVLYIYYNAITNHGPTMMISCVYWMLHLLYPTMVISCAYWVLQLLDPTMCNIIPNSYTWSNYDNIFECYMSNHVSNHDNIVWVLYIYYNCYIQPWSNHDDILCVLNVTFAKSNHDHILCVSSGEEGGLT